METDIRIYWIWLQERLGLGNPRTASLLRTWEHPRRLYEADAAALRAAGLQGVLLETLCRKSLDSSLRVLEQARETSIWIFTPDDPRYPASLLSLPDLPLVLYGRGDFPDDWDERLSVTVVGTRRLSQADRQKTAAMTAGLVACDVTVVTGAAEGADAAALEAVVACHGFGVSVLACAPDVNYPQETAALRERLLESGGVLLSEYAPGKCGGKGCYHLRNRLLSGLTAGTLVTAAPERSGALITAHWAREQGRDVFAVPGDMKTHAGCHRLIREGALLVTRSTDILQEYESRLTETPDWEAAERAETYLLEHSGELPPEPPPRRKAVSLPKRDSAPAIQETTAEAAAAQQPWVRPERPQGLSTAAQTVFDLLGAEAQPLDELARRAGLPPARMLAVMTELEMTGLVQNSAGGHYCLKG